MKLGILLIAVAIQPMFAMSMEQVLSPAELHIKLCALNQLWHQRQPGTTIKMLQEVRDIPFDLKRINESTEKYVTPFVVALDSWQTRDKAFLAYLIQHGADINNPQIMCSALNRGRFELIPWLLEASAPMIPELTGNFTVLRSIFSATICVLHNQLLVIEQNKVMPIEDKKNQMNQIMQQCIAVMKLFNSKGRSLDEQPGSHNPPLLLAANWGFVPVTEFLLNKKVSLFYGKKQKKGVINYLKNAPVPQLLCISDRDACIRLLESKIKTA